MYRHLTQQKKHQIRNWGIWINLGFSMWFGAIHSGFYDTWSGMEKKICFFTVVKEQFIRNKSTLQRDRSRPEQQSGSKDIVIKIERILHRGRASLSKSMAQKGQKSFLIEGFERSEMSLRASFGFPLLYLKPQSWILFSLRVLQTKTL